MAHILKYTEWQGSSGRWYSNDVQELGKNSGAWYYPPRMLDMPLTNFILLLKDEYKVSNFSYDKEKNFLLYSWSKENYSYCHKFTLFVNREAKKRKFMI